MKIKIQAITQSYLGMLPKDKGCTSWSQLQKKFTKEIMEVVSQSIISGDVELTCSCGKKLYVSAKCPTCDNDN